MVYNSRTEPTIEQSRDQPLLVFCKVLLVLEQGLFSSFSLKRLAAPWNLTSLLEFHRNAMLLLIFLLPKLFLLPRDKRVLTLQPTLWLPRPSEDDTISISETTEVVTVRKTATSQCVKNEMNEGRYRL